MLLALVFLLNATLVEMVFLGAAFLDAALVDMAFFGAALRDVALLDAAFFGAVLRDVALLDAAFRGLALVDAAFFDAALVGAALAEVALGEDVFAFLGVPAIRGVALFLLEPTTAGGAAPFFCGSILATVTIRFLQTNLFQRLNSLKN